ncbi:MAG: HD-GYP domain-containing protein [Proteobacteria bacterium]|nr:HD-GYP domain-containing protein [Pseudomonadota bacterium]
MSMIDFEEILKNINASLKSKKLYPVGHPATLTPLKKTFTQLTEVLQDKKSFALAIVNEALVVEDDLIEDSETLYPDLLENMAAMNVDAIVFERGLKEDEITKAVDLLGGEPLQGDSLVKAVEAAGITHITLKSIPVGKRNVLEIYNDAVGAIVDVMDEIRMGKIPKAEPVNSIVDEMTTAVFEDANAIMGLTMIKNYDNYLFNHSVNVSILCLSLAKAMGLSQHEIHCAGVGGLLHDVGKTGVSEDIIRKPGGLSSEEWEKIKEHPTMGSKIVNKMEKMDALIENMVLAHHVKYDCSGYPNVTDKVHPLTQIVTISDAYDALTTLRVYQKPQDPVEAVKLMMTLSGRHFDPATLKTFVDMVGLYPVGTMLRLATGETAIVIKGNPDNAPCPVVKVVHDEDGNTLDDPIEVDLREDPDRNIVATVNPATANIELADFFENEARESDK